MIKKPISLIYLQKCVNLQHQNEKIYLGYNKSKIVYYDDKKSIFYSFDGCTLSF